MKRLRKIGKNGVLFDVFHIFENDASVALSWDWYRLGFGIRHYMGETRSIFSIDFIFLTFEVWY